jgi:hypothetical protein
MGFSIQFSMILSHTLPGIPITLAVVGLLKLLNVGLQYSDLIQLGYFVLGTLFFGIWIDGFHHMIGEKPFCISKRNRDWSVKAEETYEYLTRVIQTKLDIDTKAMQDVSMFTWEQILIVFGRERYMSFMDYYYHYYEFFANLLYALIIFSPIAILYTWLKLDLSVLASVILSVIFIIITVLTYYFACTVFYIMKMQQVRLSLLFTSMVINSKSDVQVEKK